MAVFFYSDMGGLMYGSVFDSRTGLCLTRAVAVKSNWLFFDPAIAGRKPIRVFILILFLFLKHYHQNAT